MNCPQCSASTHVVDSRPHHGGVRRRRECTSCGARFTTMETVLVRAQRAPANAVQPKPARKRASAAERVQARRRIEDLRDAWTADNDFLPDV